MQQSALLPDGSPASTGAKQISIRSLTKTFRRSGGDAVIPVNDISLDVAPDEMLVLLGPSGCGKTTLLRCIAGLERPDTGEIAISGNTVFSSQSNILLPPNKRPISMVFQSYALWPHMTVFENVAFPLRSRGLGGEQVKERVNEILGLVGLGGLAQQYTNQISGGQQQRVALARSVVAKTGVVLFDEPLSNVDAKVREQLRGEIARIQRTLRFSGVYVTHDQIEAMAIGDRIAVLNNGRIEQLGTPEEIYMRPANKYVATFIGIANIISGPVVATEEHSVTVRTSVGDQKAPLPRGSNAQAGRLSQGDTAFLLARPDILGLTVGGDHAAGATPCTVRSRTFLGAYTEYLVAAPNGEQLRVWTPGLGTIPGAGEAWLSVASPELVLLADRD